MTGFKLFFIHILKHFRWEQCFIAVAFCENHYTWFSRAVFFKEEDDINSLPTSVKPNQHFLSLLMQ